MAHQRERYLKPLVERLTSFSPLVGLLGHRQVGKTTLLESVVKKYVTFDDEDILNQAQTNSKVFLAQFINLKNGIDECQLVPKIFPALKERVRIDKRPGQFILSGSVRFTSKRSIRESLTGRMITFELLPFTISELRHQKLPQTLHQIILSKKLTNLIQSLNHETKLKKNYDEYIELYYERGGLPGVCFVNNNKLRNEKISEQLMTILDRDLRQIHETTLSYAEIKSFLVYIAQNQGQSLNQSEIKRVLGLSYETQNKLLFALEAVFLIRSIPVAGSSAGTIYYLEDQAESNFLNPEGSELDKFEQLIYRNIRAEFSYKIGENFKLFQFKTRGQARIPFCFQINEGILGVLPILEDEPTRSHKASIRSFLSKYINSKVVVINKSKNARVMDDRSVIVPVVCVV